MKIFSDFSLAVVQKTYYFYYMHKLCGKGKFIKSKLRQWQMTLLKAGIIITSVLLPDESLIKYTKKVRLT